MKKIINSIVLAISLALSACGGGGGGSDDFSDAPMNVIQAPSAWTCLWENGETTTVRFNSPTTVDDDGVPANWEYVPGTDGKSGVLTFVYMRSNPQVKAIINLTFIDYGRANISSTVYVDGRISSREAGTIRKL